MIYELSGEDIGKDMESQYLDKLVSGRKFEFPIGMLS
jgi:hypothetical protein